MPWKAKFPANRRTGFAHSAKHDSELHNGPTVDRGAGLTSRRNGYRKSNGKSNGLIGSPMRHNSGLSGGKASGHRKVREET